MSKELTPCLSTWLKRACSHRQLQKEWQKVSWKFIFKTEGLLKAFSNIKVPNFKIHMVVKLQKIPDFQSALTTDL